MKREKEDTVSWYFPKRTPNNKATEEHGAEFFATESIKTAADSIVREFVQNSMDASSSKLDPADPYFDDSTKPVRVCFGVGQVNKNDIENEFGAIWEHVLATGPSLDGGRQDTYLKRWKKLQGSPQVRYLTIEDFGTTGLRGNPDDAMSDAKENNEMYYFIHTSGLSTKTGADKGNWGAGKSTYYYVSEVNTFFLLTVRSGLEPEFGKGPFSIGLSSLRPHTLGETQHLADGYFGKSIGGDGVYPVSNQESNLSTVLMSLFKFKRQEESGLSIVAPYIPEELTAPELVMSVLRNYGVVIVWGDLVVEVKDNETNESWQLSSDTIFEVLEKFAEDENIKKEISELHAVLELARWAREGDPEFVELGLHRRDAQPKWSSPEVLEEPQKEKLLELINGPNKFAVRVPVSVVLEGGGSEDSHFDVYFLAAEGGGSVIPHFYRTGLRISEASNESVRKFHSLVVIDDKPLVEMLGDAEPPSHVKWEDQTLGFRGKYKYGPSWLTFVRKAAREILAQARHDGSDGDVVSKDYFSRRDPGSGKEPKKPVECEHGILKKTCEVCKTPPPPPPTPPWFSYGGLKDGFSLKVSDNEDDEGKPLVPDGTELLIEMAYDISGGNLFKSYEKYDFDISKPNFDIKVDGGKLLKKKSTENKLYVTVKTSQKFKLQIRGFDPLRDVAIADPVVVDGE